MRSIKKRIISILLIITILINTIPNFGILQNVVHAASDEGKVILEIIESDENLGDTGIYYDDYFGKNVIGFSLYFNDVIATHITVPIKYDTNKLAPAGIMLLGSRFMRI